MADYPQPLVDAVSAELRANFGPKKPLGSPSWVEQAESVLDALASVPGVELPAAPQPEWAIETDVVSDGCVVSVVRRGPGEVRSLKVLGGALDARQNVAEVVAALLNGGTEPYRQLVAACRSLKDDIADDVATTVTENRIWDALDAIDAAKENDGG